MTTLTTLPVISDFAALFASSTPLIDTRAPVEFDKGSIPGAVNLPLMSNAERAAVGTCYKHQGQAAAIELGHSLVSGSARTQRIEAWLAFAEQHPSGALFCWRGGLRSQIVQQWLAEAGRVVPKIEGGYKALRRWLIDTQQPLCQPERLLILGGRTGCAKTRLLNEGKGGSPIPGSVDLEGLAHHRGSAFGRRLGGQPTQLAFENQLALALHRASVAAQNRLLLEDESRLIGRCALPPELQSAMKQAPLVLLESSLEERVEHSFENYILANLLDLERNHKDREQAFEQFAQELQDSLARVQKRLGGERYRTLKALMNEALVQHSRGDASRHREWIAIMLRDYYDPMYDYQLQQRLNRVIYRGERDDIIDFLHHRLAQPD